MILILKPPCVRWPLITVLGALTLLTQATAFGEEVPFAVASPLVDTQGGSPFMRVSLADVMSTMQLRSVRLWDAGNVGNWGLVDYETDRIVVSLKDAALAYLSMPLADVMAIRQPMLDLHAAARTKDAAKFIQAYSQLTSVCNQCHVAVGVGFIRIQVPRSPPFGDEFRGSWTGNGQAISRR